MLTWTTTQNALPPRWLLALSWLLCITMLLPPGSIVLPVNAVSGCRALLLECALPWVATHWLDTGNVKCIGLAPMSSRQNGCDQAQLLSYMLTGSASVMLQSLAAEHNGSPAQQLDGVLAVVRHIESTAAAPTCPCCAELVSRCKAVGATRSFTYRLNSLC